MVWAGKNRSHVSGRAHLGVCSEQHLSVLEGLSPEGGAEETGAGHTQLHPFILSLLMRIQSQGAPSPHTPPSSHKLTHNSPPSEKSTAACMPPVMGSLPPQETALNTTVSIPSSRASLPYDCHCFLPAWAMGQEGQPSCRVVVSTLQALSHLPAQLPWEAGMPPAAPLCRRAAALPAHPLLCRDVGGSAGSGPRDPSGPSCVPTEAPQAQEAGAQGAQEPTWEQNSPEGGGDGIRTPFHGDGLVMGWEPLLLSGRGQRVLP